MTYLNSRLTRKWRLTIMIALIVSFFIISPLVLLYTMGYRFDVKSGQVEQTGVVSIDAEPSYARVYLNDVLLHDRIPIRLPNRAPGTYHVRIEADGYHTWETDISVQSKQTTYIRDIFLIPKRLPMKRAALPSDVQLVDFSPDGKKALIIAGDEAVSDVWVRDLATDRDMLVTRFHHAKQSWDVSMSPSSPSALLSTQDSETKQYSYHFINLASPDASYTTTTAAKLEAFRWALTTPQTGYATQSDHILSLTADGTQRINAGPTSSAWSVDPQGRVWTIESEKNLLARHNSNETRILPENTTPTKTASWLSHNQLLLENDGKYTVVQWQDADVTQHSLETDMLRIHRSGPLFWSPWELWWLDKNNTPSLIHRSSNHILSAAYMRATGDIVITYNDRLMAFNPGYYTTQTITTATRINASAVNMDEQRLYFWGTVGQQSGLYQYDYSI